MEVFSEKRTNLKFCTIEFPRLNNDLKYISDNCYSKRKHVKLKLTKKEKITKLIESNSHKPITHIIL